MKDEIKEILDYVFSLAYGECFNDEREDIKKAEEYIINLQDTLKDREEYCYGLETQLTNLQEKYERMKENAKILSNGYDDLEKKNEKAIEYFKYQLEQLDFYEDTKAKMLCAMGIVILQGEDKDEKI